MARPKLNERITDALDKQWARASTNAVSLLLPYPTSVNRMWRKSATGMYRAPEYGTWFRAAGNELNDQHPGRVEGSYSLTILLGRPDRRKRDLDNTVKAISDLLVHHKVVDDDSHAQRITLEWINGIKGAHVLVRSVDSASLVRRDVAA